MEFFVNATIYKGEGAPIKKGFVSFEKGKIAAVGPMSAANPQKGDKVTDYTGHNIYPGFIDAHTHIGVQEEIHGARGSDLNEITNPITPNLRAIDGTNPAELRFAEACAAGVTTVVTGPGSANPIGGQFFAMKTQGSLRLDELVVKDPVSMKMAFGENPKMLYGERKLTPSTRMSSVAMIREHLEKARRYAEKEKPEFDSRLEALLPVVKGEMLVHMHCHRADDIFTAIRVAEEFKLNYVLVHATEGWMIADHLKALGARVISGPIMVSRGKPEMQNVSLAGPGILAKAGVVTALCTDATVTPQDYLPVSAGFAVRAGMDYNQAVASITSAAADVCGIADRVGRLQKGLDADMAVFKGDALSLEGVCVATYIAGKRIARP